jgi:hypothetical protein
MLVGRHVKTFRYESELLFFFSVVAVLYFWLHPHVSGWKFQKSSALGSDLLIKVLLCICVFDFKRKTSPWPFVLLCVCVCVCVWFLNNCCRTRRNLNNICCLLMYLQLTYRTFVFSIFKLCNFKFGVYKEIHNYCVKIWGNLEYVLTVSTSSRNQSHALCEQMVLNPDPVLC